MRRALSQTTSLTAIGAWRKFIFEGEWVFWDVNGEHKGGSQMQTLVRLLLLCGVVTFTWTSFSRFDDCPPRCAFIDHYYKQEMLSYS
jgi:hypothetical protein